MYQIGNETLKAIDLSIQKDQGNSYRGWLGRVMPHIGDAYRSDEDGRRTHLGASILGGECLRATWYNWRWVSTETFDGKTLRLFNRGHMEEGRFIAMLLSAGIQVEQQDANGKQYRISWAEGHAGGSTDGVGIGLQDLPPGTRALLEFKTHNDDSFTKLAGKDWKKYYKALISEKPLPHFEGEGVQRSKPEHYVQMQTYMRKKELPVGAYFAVNKNDDLLYCEIVPLDVTFADMWIDVGVRLVYQDFAPPRMKYASPSFFKCQWCKHHAVCHKKETPEFNCRTCTYSQPRADGLWHCNKYKVVLTKETQATGCQSYEVNPGIYK